MKKAGIMLLSLLLLLSAAGCREQSDTGAESSPAAVQTSAAEQTSAADQSSAAEHTTGPLVIVPDGTLKNKMSQAERERVSLHALTLLDEPKQEDSADKPDSAPAEHTVSIEFHTMSNDELQANLEQMKKDAPEEEYKQAEEILKPYLDAGLDYKVPLYVIVDGKLCPHYLPASVLGYDGGAFAYSTTETDIETGEITSKTRSFSSFEEYVNWTRANEIIGGWPEELVELDIRRMEIAEEALKTGKYTELPKGSVDPKDKSLFDSDPSASQDYRSAWEYDRDAVTAIRDAVQEIDIWDEALNTEFVVQVTLPPQYDKDKTYPVFFLTDGVWRFGDVPALRKLMEDRQAAGVILVTLGLSYNLDSTDLSQRYHLMVEERDRMLDFLTDDLMPYLSEQYRIDWKNTALFGHSDSGVFAHTALCKSDCYENQPFGRYVIGSPAFFGLYYHDGLDAEGCAADYGYFDRNAALGKKVFLCGGSQEDPDYADRYNGHDTTLEGLAKLKDRLASHGADVTYQLYDSHHYQYIPEMLAEYLKTAWPYKADA